MVKLADNRVAQEEQREISTGAAEGWESFGSSKQLKTVATDYHDPDATNTLYSGVPVEKGNASGKALKAMLEHQQKIADALKGFQDHVAEAASEGNSLEATNRISVSGKTAKGTRVICFQS